MLVGSVEETIIKNGTLVINKDSDWKRGFMLSDDDARLNSYNLDKSVFIKSDIDSEVKYINSNGLVSGNLYNKNKFTDQLAKTAFIYNNNTKTIFDIRNKINIINDLEVLDMNQQNQILVKADNFDSPYFGYLFDANTLT